MGTLTVTESKSVQNTLKRNQKTARFLGILLLAFFLCWAPAYISNTLNYTLNIINSPLTETICFTLLMLNSAINPVLYMTTVKRYRQNIYKLICFWKK